VIPLTISKVCHLGYMAVPDYPTKTRKIGVIYQNDSTVIATPNQLTLFGLELICTKYAIGHGKNVNENGI
jgi:hypothetical protein